MKVRIIISLVFAVFLVYDVLPCTVNVSNIKTNAVYGVVITETKEVIPNAKIQIYKNTDDGEEILAETKTDENGRFEIVDFPSGKYMIRAKTWDFYYDILAVMKLKKSSSRVKNKEIVFTLDTRGEGCLSWVEVQKIQKSK